MPQNKLLYGVVQKLASLSNCASKPCKLMHLNYGNLYFLSVYVLGSDNVKDVNINIF